MSPDYNGHFGHISFLESYLRYAPTESVGVAVGISKNVRLTCDQKLVKASLTYRTEPCRWQFNIGLQVLVSMKCIVQVSKVSIFNYIFKHICN